MNVEAVFPRQGGLKCKGVAMLNRRPRLFEGFVWGFVWRRAYSSMIWPVMPSGLKTHIASNTPLSG